MFYALSILAIHFISRKPYGDFFYTSLHDNLDIFRNRAQYDSFELIRCLEKQESFKFTAQEAQPPALLVEWESPPGAKPLRFRLKAV